MKKSITNSVDIVLLFGYLFLIIFCIPFTMRAIVYFLLAGMILIHILYSCASSKGLWLQKSHFTVICLIVLLCGGVFLTSEYSQLYLIKAYLPLLIVFLWIKNGELQPINKQSESIIWWLFFVFFIVEMIFTYMSGNSSFGFKSLFEDRNFRDFIIALFIVISYEKKRYKGAIIVFLLRLIIFSGRGYVFFLVMYFGIKILKKFRPRFFLRFSDWCGKPGRIFFLMMTLLSLLIAFSYLWVNTIGSLAQLSAVGGLRDMSNLERFNANVYAVEELLHNKEFFFSGYGGELITSIFGLDYAERELIRYNGVVLVQPHCAMLNLLMCFGIVPGFIYLIVMANLFRKVISFENVEILLAFLIYSMILWIFPNNGLEMVIFVICMLNNNKKK